MKSLTGVLIGGESIKFASQRRAGQMFDISTRFADQLESANQRTHSGNANAEAIKPECVVFCCWGRLRIMSRGLSECRK